VWDVSTGSEVKVLKGHTGWVNSVAFSSDGTQIVSGSGDESVRVWDASTGFEVKVLKVFQDRTLHLLQLVLSRK
jgi:WD40 repeat protein